MAFGRATIGDYFINIVPSMDGFGGKVRSGVQSSGIGRIFETTIGVALGNALGGAFDAFMDSLGNGIARLDTINSFQRVMVALGESPEDAAAAIGDMKAALDGLPTATNDMAAWVQQIRASGEPLDRATQLGIAMNDAMLAGGQSAADVANAMDAYNTILAKGKPDLMHWNSLVTASPAAMDQLAKSLLGAEANQMDLYDALQDGTISMDEFNDAVIRLNEEGSDGFASFEEQARAATGGIGTALQNVKNRLSNAWALILDAIGADRIAGLIDDISYHFQDLPKLLAPYITRAADIFFGFVDNVKSAFGGFKDTVLPYIQDFADGAMTAWENFQSALSSDTMQGALEGLRNGVSALSDALGPFYENVLVPLGNVLFPIIGTELGKLVETVTIVAGAVAAFVSGFMERFTAMAQFVSAAIETVKAVFSALPDAVQAIFSNVLGIVEGVPSQIVGFFTGIGDRIKATFEGATSIKDIFTGIIDFISGIPGEIVGFFSGLGSRITSAIGSIHFPTPHISWESVNIAGVQAVSIPHISWYGMGGLINGAALIGAGERGTELIWPSYSPYLERYADAIASRIGAGGVYINATTVTDAAVINVTRNYLVELQRLGAI